MTAVARSPPLSFLARLSAPTTPPPPPAACVPAGEAGTTHGCAGEGRGSASPAECRGASPCSSRGLVSQQNAGPPPCSGESGPATALPPYCDPGAGKGPQRGSREGNYPYCVARSATPSSIPCLNADCDSDQLNGHLDFTTHGKGPGPQCTHRPDVASAPVPPAVRVALTQEPLWTDCQIY